MPFPMKVQPIDSPVMGESFREADSAKPVFKSRFRRLFHRQLPVVLRVSSAEKLVGTGCEESNDKLVGATAEFEPSSVCLDKMVQNFIEESNDKQSAVPTAKCSRNRCNCFNGNGNDSSDDEFDPWNEYAPTSVTHGDSSDIIKSLVPCASMAERNLLADTAKIVEQQSKNFKRKDDLRNMVTDGLSTLGYDVSICKSRWAKSSYHPAGEYEYIDVIVEGGERLLIDIDFRSEFEVARSTGTYKTILQSLPFIFVGNAYRLQQIVSAVSEAAKQSLKKKGMDIPPWRKEEYMRAKWLSPYIRATTSSLAANNVVKGSEAEVIAEECRADKEEQASTVVKTEIKAPGLQLIFGEQSSSEETKYDEILQSSLDLNFGGKEEKSLVSTVGVAVVRSPWQPPALTPRSSDRRAGKVVTGLSSLLKEKQ